MVIASAPVTAEVKEVSFSYTPTTLDPRTFQAKYLGAGSNGYNSSESFPVTVTPRPAVGVTISAESYSICPGSSTNLIFDFTGNEPWSVTFIMNRDLEIQLTDITDSHYLYPVDPSSTSAYTLVSVSDDNYTEAASGSITITVTLAACEN